MSVAALPGGMLGARTRLRPLPLSLVGWCASCNNDNNNEHWDRTSTGFSLSWECGRSRPPEYGVAPLVRASNPKATPVRVTTMGWWGSIVLVDSPPRRWKTPNLNPDRWSLLALADSSPSAGITNKSPTRVVGTRESWLTTPLVLVERIKHRW